MPHFYFHRRTDQGLRRDDIGIECPDLDAAYLEAFRAAKDLWDEFLQFGNDPTNHVFEIAEADGRVLLELPACEVLDSAKGQRRRPASGRAGLAAERARRTLALAADLARQVDAARENISKSQALLKRQS